MNCEEIDFIAYRDHQLTPEKERETKEHLDSCSRCSAELRAIDHILNVLTTSWQELRSACPEGETLTDYYYGGLNADDKKRLETHLKHCPLCSEKLSLLKAFERTYQEPEKLPAGPLPESISASLKKLKKASLKDRLSRSIETFVKKGKVEIEKKSGKIDELIENLMEPDTLPQAAVRKKAADVDEDESKEETEDHKE